MQISAANTPAAYAIQKASLSAAAAPKNPATQNTNKPASTSATNNIETGKPRQQGQAHELSDDEKSQVKQLQSRDREVRAHEAAHLAAAGGLARGGASFSYQTGPDGRAYAVGGEVSIDTSAVNDDPQATILKARTIRAAALAPAQPSSADQAAAAAASALEAAARIELAAKQADEQSAEQQGESKEKPTQTTDATIDATTDETTEKSAQTDLAAKNARSEINHYQNNTNPSAASDLVGQLLNTSA